jgi:hypothetical protein
MRTTVPSCWASRTNVSVAGQGSAHAASYRAAPPDPSPYGRALAGVGLWIVRICITRHLRSQRWQAASPGVYATEP